MGLSVAGRESVTTIAGGAWQMWVQGERIAALLIALFGWSHRPCRSVSCS